MNPATSCNALSSPPLAFGWHRLCAAVAGAALAVSLTGPGAASDGGEPAIPPGQEEVLLDVFGKGKDFAGCRLVDGQAVFTEVVATYKCGSAEATVAAVHRDKGGRESVRTERFAITLQGGSPPPAFMNALVSHVRSREGQFEWLWLYDPPRVAEPADDAGAKAAADGEP